MFILLVLLLVCHWLADFTPLSTPWMLKAKRVGYPYAPIFLHASVHGVLMGGVLSFWVKESKMLIGLVAFEVFTHFVIDVGKGRLNQWFPALQNSATVPY